MNDDGRGCMRNMTTGIDTPTLVHESEEIRRLFDGLSMLGGFTATDLREMAKFTEQVNIHGLAAHPISRPIGGESIRVFGGTLSQLPGKAPGGGGGFEALHGLLGLEPVLHVRGAVGGACGRPFIVSAFVPQSQACLAHAFNALLWPVSDGTAPSDLYLIQVPDSIQPFIVHVPESRTVFVSGIDDPRAGLVVIIESAYRAWKAVSPQLHEQEEDCAGGDDHDHSTEDGHHHGEGIPAVPSDGLEPVALLPGGCLLLGDATLIFSGESIPHEWELKLIDQHPTLAGETSASITLAQAEPWVAEGGGRVGPLWRNPPFPARMLAGAPGWAGAGIHWDTLAFGVAVDESGRIDLAGSGDDAFVIIPREAVPAPFSSAPGAVKVRKLITHRFAKNDAMRLWAALFPPPVVV